MTILVGNVGISIYLLVILSYLTFSPEYFCSIHGPITIAFVHTTVFPKKDARCMPDLLVMIRKVK